ncbi:MAG TPA: ribosome silencing factor [bacterium]|nr:ribosome silencing factor [bacterium]
MLDKIVGVLEDKKAIDIRILDLSELVSYTDFMVVCSGTSHTHVAALVSSVEDSFSQKEGPVYVNSSKDDSWWILDFVDIVVHVFKEESRAFYDLEGLWSDAKELKI